VSKSIIILLLLFSSSGLADNSVFHLETPFQERPDYILSHK